ncbi:MAG: ATP-binding protein, partial [Deltaproteobacteria bacterium]|nr:ATP-binding protein [Deltaproteobacteria bacterium]MBW2537821.1 ATP-binding protein [Deltaproteobacteria bacterium]
MQSSPPSVQILDPVVANQIAAGEVVTRPASVVKELVENAIDAGATRIDVTIAAGGTERIVVADDGHGMAPSDLRLAIERHATSKIRLADDLLGIGTLGFRGEALPSIASVSRFAIRTRIAGESTGTELCVEGGEVLGTSPIGCAPGTTVEVADLFYNVPARRKFLRALSTESAHVTAAVRNAALANPRIRVTLTRDGRRAKQWLRVDDWAERVRQVLGLDRAARCEGERGPVAIAALVGLPDAARAGASALHLFVNDRPVQDR